MGKEIVENHNPDDGRFTGKTPGPGRPKGVASKRTIADLAKVTQVLTEKGYDPISELIDLARSEGTSLEKRQEIALVILPYVYSRQPAYLASAQDGEDEGGMKMSFTVTL